MFQNPILLFFFQDEDPETKSQNLLGIIVDSGPIGWVIFSTLFVLSIIGTIIFVERWRTIKRAGRIDENFMDKIRSNVSTGSIEAAKALCQNTDSPLARMVEKGLQRIGKPLRDIDTAIENVGNLELFKLEKNLSTLATISGAAPMLGFFGTVTGMIQAFYDMSNAPSVTPKLLAGGIYQALMTTAFGLFIGILAFLAYNTLVANVEKVVFKMEKTTVDFMDLLQEPS